MNRTDTRHAVLGRYCAGDLSVFPTNGRTVWLYAGTSELSGRQARACSELLEAEIIAPEDEDSFAIGQVHLLTADAAALELLKAWDAESPSSVPGYLGEVVNEGTDDEHRRPFEVQGSVDPHSVLLTNGITALRLESDEDVSRLALVVAHVLNAVEL